MKHTRTSLVLVLAAALLLGFVSSPPAHAATGSPGAIVIKGTVQSIDYLHHAITVNKQTYVVAKNAKFNGVAGFSVLHVGMPIAYSLESPPDNAVPGEPPTPSQTNGPPTISQITWLPGGA